MLQNQIQNMESQFQSKASIKSNINPIVTFNLQQHPTIIKNIQNLIFEQAKIELGLSSDIDQRLKSSYEEAKLQLQLELRRAESLKWDRALDQEQKSQIEQRVRLILQKMRKLKEINIYFGDLTKQGGSLEADVEKFMFYQPKSCDFESKVLSFLSQPTVSQLILKQHERNFNNNNFLAQIIEFYHFLAKHQLLNFPPEYPNERLRNQDLAFIQNNNLIFRQICQISDKYSLIQQQLEKAYLHLEFLRRDNQQEVLTHKKYKQETEIIRNKLKQLNTLAKKIRGNPSFSYQQIIVIPEESDIFFKMNQSFEYSLKDRNESFLGFLEEIYEGKPVDFPKTNTGNFQFLRKKIIKAEMCWNLNRLISAFNIGSYCVNQLHDSIPSNPKIYKFNHPSELIKYQINEKRVSFYSQREPDTEELQVCTKNFVIVNRQEGHTLRREKNKILYPSAILKYYHLLKYFLALSTILFKKNIYSEQLLLEITQIKANQYSQWAETALTFYQIIKNKYFTAYKPLQEYLQVAFNCQWVQQLEWIERQITEQNNSEYKILAYFTGKQRKAGWINQIIFQLDSTQDITEALTKLLEIELEHNLSGHCSDKPHFYQLILNEIIQTRNNLKFDRCYSLNSLQQLFAFPTAHPGSLQDLAKQLAPLCRDRIKLSQLLRFQACQGKLKRQVFKAQLYWTNIVEPSVKNKFIFVSQRKKISFKDFLEENAKYILGVLDQNLSFFISNIEEVERAVALFSQQVQRLKIIQSSLLLLKPDFPLEDHLSAFSHKQLLGFFTYCSEFNFIQDIFKRREKKNWVLNQIRKLLNQYKLKFADLNMEMWTVILKQILGGFIFFIYSLQHHLTREDCINLKQKVIANLQPPQYHLKIQILRSKREALKEYQDSQFLQGSTLAEFVQIYQLLIHISLNEVIKRNDVPIQDKIYLEKIRASLPSNQPLRLLQSLKAQENIKRMTSSKSKTHSLTFLRCILIDFKQKKQTFKGYCKPWKTIQYLFMLPQIGIVTRRIFCNQLIILKSKVSGEEWKSFNKRNCLGKLRQMIQVELIEKINQFLIKDIGTYELLNSHFNLTQNINLLSQYTKRYIVYQYNQRYSFEEVQKKPIVLFDQSRGIEIDYQEDTTQLEKKRYTKKGRVNPKRGLLNSITSQDAQTTIFVNNLQQKVNLQIVKQSLKMRKAIYRLQLQQKRIKDQIVWETCKLQHNVVKKINCFIEQSNLDQKQSLINFKYTVNLQTIKGIQNVIHQRTQIFGKKANQDSSDEMLIKKQQELEAGFVTEPKEKQVRQSQQSLLDLNVRNIFNHVKKIKIFWAWKNMYMSKQTGQDEWKQFSLNVQKILHNRQNMTKQNELQVERQNCGKNEIVCNLIKEQSNLLNNIIKNTKINHLTQKLSEFKAKHSLEEQIEQTI